jgi:hypothetical protein
LSETFAFLKYGGSNLSLLFHVPATMSTEELLQRYQGHIVPQSYNAGFVALSYVVSLVGAGSTLELINRRTGLRGLFNQYVSALITKSPDFSTQGS